MGKETGENNIRAINALIQIMADGAASMRRRIEAAEAILSYEAPEEAVEYTKQFLVTVFENREEVSTDDRLEAGKLMRKAEAKKITQQTAKPPVDDEVRRESWRQIEIAKRRLKLFEAGLWEDVPKDWAADLLSPDHIPLPPDAD